VGFPQIKVEIAFVSDPFTTPDFTGGDVIQWLGDRIVIRRGRADDFAEFRAGTATVTLKNSDRRFDPDNSSSPIYARPKLMRDIRITAEWASVVYPLFYGYITDWDPRYANGTYAFVDLTCADGFEPLSRLEVGTPDTPVTLAAATGDVRVVDVLDNVGWPAGARTIDTASSFDLQESILDGVPALEYLQLVARSEDGQFFIGKEGNAHFEGRLFRSISSSSGTWGDAADGSELAYVDLKTNYSVYGIWNRAQIMAEGDTHVMQVSDDTASQTTYLTRTVSRTGLLNDDDADCLIIATNLTDIHSSPRVRAKSLKPQPHVGDTWAEVLGREISDRILVRRQTVLGGALTEIECFIEGIGLDMRRTKEEWTIDVDWYLSSI
jgi:hypothetical protein